MIARVQGDDVVALVDHRPPPRVLDVVLEQDAVVPVVVGVAEAAVDLRRGEDEAAALAQRHDLVHGHDVVGMGRSLCSPAVPIYEYRCENGHLFEVMRKITDVPLTECQECGAPVVKVLHSPGRPLQGIGLLQHGLRDLQAQARAGEVRVRRRRQERRQAEGQAGEEGARRSPLRTPKPASSTPSGTSGRRRASPPPSRRPRRRAAARRAPAAWVAADLDRAEQAEQRRAAHVGLDRLRRLPGDPRQPEERGGGDAAAT